MRLILSTTIISFVLIALLACNTHSIQSDRMLRFDADTVYVLEDSTANLVTIKSKPDEDEVEPKVIYTQRPEYPEEARRQGIEADVMTKVIVNKLGEVRRAFVVSSTDQQFNRSAMAAAMQWRFEPALKKGQPINVWVSIPFRFRLQN